jgi:type II secretory pathway pseudopilin PulG
MSTPLSTPLSSRPPALLWWLAKLRLSQQGQPSFSTTQGLTIIECLVAIMLIGLTIAMVTPPLLIATASRIQTRRAEQAMQIAQGEVDRISTLVQQGNHRSDQLPALVGNLSGQGGPTSLANAMITSRAQACAPPAPTAPTTANQAVQIDVDGDCQPDFFMQVFRATDIYTQAELSGGRAPAARRPAQFDLGVRVYSILARRNLGAGLRTDPASLRMTSGQGTQASNPLAVVYRPVIWGEQADVLCNSVSRATRNQIGTCPTLAP